MARRTLVIYSDFICPFCYLGKVNAERLRDTNPGLTLEWREFELHPEGLPHPGNPFLGQVREKVAQLAADYDIDMRPEALTEVTDGSRRALLGLVYARDHGLEDVYRDAVFAAHWVENRDIGDIEELSAIAADIGLDEDAFRQAVRTDTGRDRLEKAMEKAFEQGIDGVPTFVCGARKVAGAVPLTSLQRLIDHPTGA